MQNENDYKKCPFCGRLIAADAAFCKHCNRVLPYEENIKAREKRQEYIEQKYGQTQYNIGMICTFIVVLALVYSFLGDVWFQLSHISPKVSKYELHEAALPGSALQEDLKPPIQMQINSGKKYRILMAQAKYSLTGMIVAKNTNFWLRGLMQNEFDEVVPMDVGVVWGRIADVKYLKKHFKFKSKKTQGEARVLFWRYDSGANESRDYISSHVSHNHLIPANDNVLSALLKIKKWDTVKLDGYLVDVIYSNGMSSYTSLSRTDEGFNTGTRRDAAGAGGACEIFYVTGVQIGKKYYK